MRKSSPSLPSRPASMDTVLNFAWDFEEFNASDVIEHTGLTRSTSLEAIDRLLDINLLQELPNSRDAGAYSKGRPARSFSLNARSGLLIGVDADRDRISATVSDLKSNPIAESTIRLGPKRDDAQARKEAIRTVIDQALSTSRATRKDVYSLCIGVPAPVDLRGLSPEHKERFWDQMNPNLVEEFPWSPLVQVENDAVLAAQAEGAIGSAKGMSNYIALLSGQRFGAGVVVGDNPLHGSRGGVGEMDFLDQAEGVGSPAGLGERIPLIFSRLAEQKPSQALTAEQILEFADQGSVVAQKTVEEASEVLARVVSILVGVFDPETVVISGELSSELGSVIQRAEQLLPDLTVLMPPPLVKSKLGGNVVSIGAIAAASQQARSRILDVLMKP